MISIIITSFNHQQYIIDCLQKVLEIKLPGREIIVIDDGSTDNTIKVVEDFIFLNNLSNEIKVIKKVNSGLISSLNLGLSLAINPYIYFTASDDIPIPTGITDLYDLMLNDSALDFIIGGGISFFENGSTQPIYSEAHIRFFNLELEKQHMSIFLGYPHPILLQSTLFKKDALNNIGGWDSELVLDDYPTFIKLISQNIKKGIRSKFLPENACIYYRHHSNNSYKNILRQFNMVRFTILKLCPINLQTRSIAVYLSFYVLSALKRGNIKVVFSLLSYLDSTNLFWFFRASLNSVFRRIVNERV